MISNEKVVARWARDNPAQWPAGQSRNVLFEGPTLYSYGRHFPLAHWADDAHGQRCVLANLSEKRSVSTSRHQRLVEDAVRGSTPAAAVHDVANPLAEGRAAHEDNLTAIRLEINTTLSTLRRARAVWRKAAETDEVDRLVDGAKAYASAFGLSRVEHPLPCQEFAVGEVVLATSQWDSSAKPALAVVERSVGRRRWLVTSPVDGSSREVHEVCLTRSK